MKNLISTLILGAGLVFSGCENNTKETKTFTGVVQDKYSFSSYRVYILKNNKESIQVGIYEDQKDIFKKGDSVNVGYANVLENQFVLSGNWEHSVNKGKIKDINQIKMDNLSILLNYEILK